MFVDELAALPRAVLVPCIIHCSADAFQGPATGRGSRKTPGDPETEQAVRHAGEVLEGLRQQGLVEFLPAGYTGAPHAVLSRDEARLEAEWALANPWKSGFADRFGGTYPRLLPFWTDLSRQDLNLAILGLFSSLGLGLARLPGYGESLVWQTSAELEFIPVLRLPNLRDLGVFGAALVTQARIRRLVARFPASPAGKPGLVVHLPWIPGSGNLAGLFRIARNLEKQGHAPATTLRTLPVSALRHPLPAVLSPADTTPWGPSQPVLGPESRLRLFKLSEVRQSRSSVAERVRSQLLQARPEVQDHPDYPAAYPERPQDLAAPNEAGALEFAAELPKTMQRGLISAMQGSATMMADTFSIRFHEGMAQAFSSGEEEIRFSPVLARVWQARNRSASLDSEGAIAFESDRVRGLRHNLVLEPEGASLPGKIRMDYVLSDRTPCLLLDIFIRYPWLAQESLVTRLCPLAFELMPVLDAGAGALEVAWTNPDGSPATVSLGRADPRESRRLYCPGTAWSFSWTGPGGVQRGFAVRRLPGESRHPAPMVLDWKARGKTPVLTLQPEGEWQHFSSRELKGLHHHLTLAVQPLFDSPMPDLDSLVERDFEKFFMFRDSGETPPA